MPRWLDRLLPKLTIEPEEEHPVVEPRTDAGDDARDLQPVG
jgi:hypothetical protein